VLAQAPWTESWPVRLSGVRLGRLPGPAGGAPAKTVPCRRDGAASGQARGGGRAGAAVPEEGAQGRCAGMEPLRALFRDGRAGPATAASLPGGGTVAAARDGFTAAAGAGGRGEPAVP
jgi:hypothetical protein